MATFNVEINSNAGKDGLYTLFIRITENRKNRRVKLDFKIHKDHFNRQAKYGKWIRLSNPKHATHNKAIQNKIDEIRDKYEAIAKTSDSPLNLIKKNPKRAAVVTLKAYFDSYLAALKMDSSIPYYRHVESKLNRFVDYFKGETSISDINTAHISEYKTHLLSAGISGVTVNDNMRRVKAVFIIAVNDDTILKNPFRVSTKAKVTESNRVKLSDAQIEALVNLDLPKGRKKQWMHHTKNYYLFSYYNAGIRVADLIQLRRSNITETNRLEYEMDKTGHKKSIQLNAQSIELLKEYLKPDANQTDYLFPILDNKEEFAKFVTYSEKRKMPMDLREKLHGKISSNNTIINKQLKEISEKLELKNTISFHTSRHSYADKARRAMKTSKKITIIDIMNSLGHKKIATTQGYINSFDKESLDEAMGDIFS